ncbi:cytochrome c oxidase assembly protein [Qipengyuania sediminis]|uniref:cytochrome c oxidase assembly protein n=1 Tax=Qipengyuania sediminis TaxID=1532023 RepID=UPI00105A3C1C|nr:cytochrome c oxidase assembly protein [Qipengyuania sediminis]
MSGLALPHGNARTALLAAGFALFMLAMGFAAVPLYRLFCQVTGFGGTTMRATESEALIAERIAQSAGAGTISIRFDASQDRGLPWRFSPAQSTQAVAIGQRQLAFYTARNDSDRPVTGRATFNVEPEQAGKHFHKIQCFCFTEQTLQPGEEVRMPVLYYVDPSAARDANMKGVEQITLSYTFHQARDAS